MKPPPPLVPSAFLAVAAKDATAAAATAVAPHGGAGVMYDGWQPTPKGDRDADWYLRSDMYACTGQL